ncbi:MAG: multidrug transporter [Kurthia sp.]|nr:multidrug transporter [Candidatus Kurthia equi]
MLYQRHWLRCTHGLAVNNMVHQIGAGAVGTAVVGIIFSTQAKTHATDLVAGGIIAETIKNLSLILGASDAYYFMIILGVIARLATLFTPSKKKLEMVK